MRDNGVILPMPRKKSRVAFNETPGVGLGFSISIEHEEYITIAQAAKILGVTKVDMEKIVESKQLKKHDENGGGYLLLKSDIESIKE